MWHVRGCNICHPNTPFTPLFTVCSDMHCKNYCTLLTTLKMQMRTKKKCRTHPLHRARQVLILIGGNQARHIARCKSSTSTTRSGAQSARTMPIGHSRSTTMRVKVTETRIHQVYTCDRARAWRFGGTCFRVFYVIQSASCTAPVRGVSGGGSTGTATVLSHDGT